MNTPKSPLRLIAGEFSALADRHAGLVSDVVAGCMVTDTGVLHDFQASLREFSTRVGRLIDMPNGRQIHECELELLKVFEIEPVFLRRGSSGSNRFSCYDGFVGHIAVAADMQIEALQDFFGLKSVTLLPCSTPHTASTRIPAAWAILETLPHLTNLEITGNREQIGMTSFSLPPNLNHLSINGTKLSEFSVTSPGSVLEKLDLSNNNFNRFSGGTGMPNLWSLNLSLNPLTAVEKMEALSNLRMLTLNNTSVSSLSFIPDLKQLEFLTVNRKFSASSVLDLAPLEGNSSLTHFCCDDSVKNFEVLNSIPTLKTLELAPGRSQSSAMEPTCRNLKERGVRINEVP